MNLEFGILLALACAFFTNLGFLYKHRGVGEVPAVDFRHPMRSTSALFSSRWFVIGWFVALGGLALHVGALALAPISIVQSVIASGLVFLAVLAERFFGYKLGLRQWAGIVVTAIGLLLLALTVGRGGAGRFSPGQLVVFEGVAVVLGMALLAGPRFSGRTHQHGMMIGASAGILIGVSDIAIKAMTDIASDSGTLSAMFSPWMALALAMAVVSFFAIARGLQTGDAVPVIAAISVSANVVQIVGGIVAFGDPMPAQTLGIVAQALGFAMVCFATALMPGPIRAAALAEA